MNWILIFSIIAGLLQLAGYVIYYLYTLKQKIKPNPASWLIWTYGNILVCSSFILADGSVGIIDILPFVCSISAIILTLLFFIKGKFRWPNRFEYYIISFDVVVTIFWIFQEFLNISFLSLQGLHLITVASAAISFIPIYKELLYMDGEEHPLAWLIWTFAYLFLLFVVLLETPFDVVNIIYPWSYAFLHGIVALLSIGYFNKNVKKSRS